MYNVHSFYTNDNKMKVIHGSWLEEVISVAGKMFGGFYLVVT